MHVMFRAILSFTPASAAFGERRVLNKIKKKSEAAVSKEEKKPRGSRRPAPFKDIFDSQVVPVPKSSPCICSCAVFRAVMRETLGLDLGVLRTLEKLIRMWRAEHVDDKNIIFRQKKEPGRVRIPIF